jgi:hypothetical protein
VSAVEPDAVTADALARLQLAARRHRCEVRLRQASRALQELLAFMGLRDVLPDDVTTRVGPVDRRAGRAARYRGRR